MSQGGRRDHQVDRAPAAWLATLPVNSRINQSICASTRRVKWQGFKVCLNELKMTLTPRAGQLLRNRMRTGNELSQGQCGDRNFGREQTRIEIANDHRNRRID